MNAINQVNRRANSRDSAGLKTKQNKTNPKFNSILLFLDIKSVYIKHILLHLMIF